MQGYFGGLVDLVFQRVLEIWSSTPSLYVHHHRFGDLADEASGCWSVLMVLFGWTSACRRGAGRIPARAQFRICPRRPRAWGCLTG
ncbi:MAG: hypothetical protein V9G14_10935 [Cypionkella sp.]